MSLKFSVGRLSSCSSWDTVSRQGGVGGVGWGVVGAESRVTEKRRNLSKMNVDVANLELE